MDSSTHAEETAEFMQKWMEKADKDFSNDIHLRTALVGSFEALKCINLNDAHQHQYLINSMAFDREAAYKFDDKINTDPQRQFVYGLHGSLEKVMGSVLVRPGGDIMRPREDAARPRGDIVRPAQEETAQETQEPEPIPMGRDTRREATPVSPVLFSNVKLENVKLEYEEENLLLEDFLAKNKSDYLPDNESTDGLPRSALTGTIQTAKPRGRRGSNSGGRPSLDAKRKREESPCYTPRTRSSTIRTLKCRICSAGNMNISGFVYHLRNEHQSTPGQEKIAFKCDCGFIANNYVLVSQHSNQCEDSSAISIIDKPLRDLAKPREAFVIPSMSKVLEDYVAKNRHNSLTDNVSMPLSAHSTGTNGKMNLLSRDVGGSEDEQEESPPARRRKRSQGITTLKCHLCSAGNMNISGFVYHLRNEHQSTPGQEKIAFKCDCGFIACSYVPVHNHSRECGGVLSVIDKPIGDLASPKEDVVIPNVSKILDDYYVKTAQGDAAQETPESEPILMEGDKRREATSVMLNVNKGLESHVARNWPNSPTGNESMDGMLLLSPQSTGSNGKAKLLSRDVGGAENTVMKLFHRSVPRSLSIKTLKCRLCSADSMNIGGFMNHLRNEHQTTPGQEKIAFKCDCGYTTISYVNVIHHCNQCASTVVKVIDKPLGGKS